MHDGYVAARSRNSLRDAVRVLGPLPRSVRIATLSLRFRRAFQSLPRYKVVISKAWTPALIDSTSEQFLGQWKRLVSTTNWEKGAIIHAWRMALEATRAPVSEYSDEAWSRRVGNVTPQHVGRLRRVFDRFGEVRDDYQGLYWSHFQAALDWDDAELWLEGAVQEGWSISQMRHQRWETHGAVADEEPRDDEQAVEAPWTTTPSRLTLPAK